MEQELEEIIIRSLLNSHQKILVILTLACGKYRFNDLDLGRY